MTDVIFFFQHFGLRLVAFTGVGPVAMEGQLCTLIPRELRFDLAVKPKLAVP
jgi:hypothetical protein